MGHVAGPPALALQMGTSSCQFPPEPRQSSWARKQGQLSHPSEEGVSLLILTASLLEAKLRETWSNLRELEEEKLAE